MIKWIKARWKPYLMILLAVQLFVYFKGCASSFLLYPSTDHHNAMGATSRPVETENGRLEVWAFRTKACRDAEPLAYVLSFCGNGSRAEDMAWWTAERWRNRPVEVWSLNYPGYGGSEGAAALNKIPPAALATYDSLRAVAKDRPIFIDSDSLGTAASIYVAAKRPVVAMILKNPPPLRSLVFQRHGWWNLWLLATPVALQIPAELNAPTMGPYVNIPACFLLSDHDEVVPPRYHDMVVKAYAGPTLVIDLPYAGHNSPVDAQSEKKVQAWLEQQWSRVFPATQPVR